jgi:hypothetical protein
MYDCKREHGAAFVHMGVDGRWIVPIYLIVYDDELYSYFGAFNGRSHKNAFEEEPLKPSWSRRRMTLEEVMNLLGSIRTEMRDHR